MRKVQLTLTTQEAEIIAIKASQLGYNVTKYIKALLGKEILDTLKELSYPVFKLSEKAEKKVAKAQEEYLQGKAVELKSIDDLDKFV